MKQNVNNWLRTPYVNRGTANRLYVETTFTIRDCSEFPYQALTCKETFALLYYEAKTDFADSQHPLWNEETYKAIDRIAADKGRYSSQDDADLSVETRSIPVSEHGVYFAFRDEGACTSLLAIKVFKKIFLN